MAAKNIRIQRIESGSRLERLIGDRPYLLAQGEWYGRTACVFERISDGRVFTVYPRGAMPNWLDKLEAKAMEKL